MTKTFRFQVSVLSQMVFSNKWVGYVGDLNRDYEDLPDERPTIAGLILHDSYNTQRWPSLFFTVLDLEFCVNIETR